MITSKGNCENKGVVYTLSPKRAWRRFEKTGEIYDYMQYKQSFYTGISNTVRNEQLMPKENNFNDSKNYGGNIEAPQFR